MLPSRSVPKIGHLTTGVCAMRTRRDHSSSNNGLGTPTSIDRHALPRPVWGLILATSRFSLVFKCTAVARPLRYVLGFDAGHKLASAARV